MYLKLWMKIESTATYEKKTWVNHSTHITPRKSGSGMLMENIICVEALTNLMMVRKFLLHTWESSIEKLMIWRMISIKLNTHAPIEVIALNPILNRMMGMKLYSNECLEKCKFELHNNQPRHMNYIMDPIQIFPPAMSMFYILVFDNYSTKKTKISGRLHMLSILVY